jgi:hypothetical protein
MENVYIVLRPLNLSDAPEAVFKKLGKVVKAIEFEDFLVLQHWGVLIGDRYYHLHLDETKRLSVSLAPFHTANISRNHTIKIPIWRTNLTHEERVGVGIASLPIFNQSWLMQIVSCRYHQINGKVRQ